MRALLPLLHLLHLTAGQGEGRGQGWPLGTNLSSKQLQKLLVWLEVTLLWSQQSLLQLDVLT